MSRGRWCLVMLAAVLGACGGSQNQVTSASSTPAAAASPTSTGQTTTTHAAHASRRRHRSKHRTPAPSDVRLPATFVIHAGGALSPPAISAPTSVDIELTVVSGDGQSHRVRLRSPGGQVLSVPAGGRASAVIRGLKQGTYALDVDGVPRGALVIGVSPGP